MSRAYFSSRLAARLPVALLSIAAIIGVLLVLRSAGLLRQRDQDSAMALVKEGERAYRRLPVFSLSAADSPADIVASISAALPRDTVDRNAALIEVVSEFLYYRFCQTSLDSYVSWRQRSGYRLAPAAELRRTWFIDADYESVFGEPYPGDEHLEDVFERFWNLSADAETGSRVAGVASDSAGICIARGALTRGLSARWPTLEGELGAELWHGQRVSSPRRWWRPQQTITERIERFGEIEAAIVGIVVECDDGSREPYQFSFARDPGRAWLLEWVAVANFRQLGSQWEY